MAIFNETHKGEQYINGEWLVEVVEVLPTKVKTKVLKPPYKAGNARDFVASDWAAYTLYSKIEEPPDDPKNEYTFVFDDENKCIVVRDHKGREVAKLPGFYGKDGKSFFDIWAEKEKLEDRSWENFLKFWRGKRGDPGDPGATPYIGENGNWFIEGKDTGVKARGQDGRNGNDGKSAYEFWKEKQPAGKDSEIDFRSFLEGKPGDPGESAFQLWQKLYPDEPNKTEEGFLRWIAQQVETQQGEPGDTYVPFVHDGKLFFRKNGGEGPLPFDPINIIGEVGDTYEPHIDEDGNLWFTSKKGDKPTTPVNIKGEQGKSAYELWLAEPGNANKSYEEYKESLRGADGVNVKAKYDFKDLEDWTCPVQEIPTHLLLGTDGIEDNKKAEGILKDRAEEINRMRKEGDDQPKGPKWWIKHLFKEVTWWCAGADKSLLRMCPGDHSKYAGIGTVILFTALMAWLSGAYAMYFIFKSKWIAAAFGLFWGAMIFFLDRFITNTMYSDGKVTISWLEFRSALPRIVISILLGIVISAPLELKIFDKEIQEYLLVTYNEKAQEKAKESKSYIVYKDAYEKACDVRNKAWEHFNETQNSRGDTIKFGKVVATLSNTTEKKKRRETSKSESYTSKKVFDEEKWKDQKNTDSIAYLNADLKAQSALRAFTTADSIAKQKAYDNLIQEGSGLFDNLMALHAIAMKKNANHSKAFQQKNQTKLSNISTPKNEQEGYHPLNWEWWKQLITGAVIFFLLMSFTFKSYFGTFGDDEEVMAGKSRRWNFITNIPICLVVAAICALCYESFHWLFYYLTTAVGLIMLLFIIIDVSPVFYKMMLADGIYDKILEEDKQIAETRIRLSIAKTLYKMDQSELKNVTPFVFDRAYQKMITKEAKEDFFVGPVGNNAEVSRRDKALFERVLRQKELIIQAAYDAWFRNMRDAIIGGSQSPEDETYGPEYQPEDNFTQEPGASHDSDAPTDNSDDFQDGEFQETDTHNHTNGFYSEQYDDDQRPSSDEEDNSKYEKEIDDEDLKQPETPLD